MICSGGDPDVSAKAAGHSKETKTRYYKKSELRGSTGVVWVASSGEVLIYYKKIPSVQ